MTPSVSKWADTPLSIAALPVKSQSFHPFYVQKRHLQVLSNRRREMQTLASNEGTFRELFGKRLKTVRVRLPPDTDMELARDWPRTEREKLQKLLQETDEAVAVAAACRQVRSTLAGLVRQAGRGDGRPAK